MSEASTTPAAAKPRKRTTLEVLAQLRQPKVAVMLALGFGSGLPFLLTGNTFGYWLREEGTTLKAIGFLSWVGLAYSFKYLWAPLVDRIDAPVLGFWFGRRRSWMIFSQILVALGLLAMAVSGPGAGLALVGAFALVVAFSSATQDIVVDAWRIEAADDSEELGLLSSAYQLGYRAALLATDALILASAQHFGWNLSYGLAAAAMTIAIFASFRAMEPAQAESVLAAKAPLWTPRGLFDSVIGPFIAFFKTHRELGVLMLLAVALYRIPDFVMGPMANPYYHDLGLTKDMVALVRGTTGLAAALIGIAVGGFSAIRLGFFPTLIIGAILQPIAVAAFAILAYTGGDWIVFNAVMAGDNFAMAYAGVALVTYMSSLTGLGYTATQYALLSSTYAILGKFLKGFSGAVVEGLTPAHGLMPAYAIFFIGAGLVGVPALILFLILARAHGKMIARQEAEAAA
ncbi:PAT family beta-lactamase induction signal transducer AmpG [Caulobacter ginsengisoli]|uniref:PAT family beta-lactamase induction signal transducer AmpG n=1 Tax=Caulobacter ginsengisoli TaxID=400775 RepID=A0ABU0IYA9_9CAUL|nr:MFS transporter [Caulobacter ginsengisoli]MDQ0466989.1 PAT family beta-lactamase induction signal transducer AmpG [Caulobacter ginsengisoli]